MDRRRFLYVAGMMGAIAGCSGADRNAETAPPSDTAIPTETDTETATEIATETETETETPTIEAEIHEKNLSVNPTKAFTDETVNVTVDVENTGGKAGTHQIELFIDGESRESVQEEVGPGESTTVEFSVNIEEPGMHEIRIGESTKVVRVDPAPDFRISSLQDLQQMEQYLSVDYALVDDIDASETRQWNDGKGFNPIGSESNPFTGTFNGRGYEINGLYIDRREILGVDSNDGDGVGLFKSIGEDAVVKDVGVTNVEITGANNVGTIVGSGNTGTIRNSHSSGNVSIIPVDDYDYNWQGGAGGLVGSGGEIENSYSTATVNGGSEVGGLVGRGGSVTDSFANGRVSGEKSVGGLIGIGGDAQRTYSAGYVTGEDRVGGLVGYDRGSIGHSYSTADVEGNTYVGGLVGRARESGSPSSCYSTGRVDGDENVGGFIGHADATTRFTGRYSFWDVDTSGQTNSGGDKEEGKPTSLMQSIDTYPSDYWNMALIEEHSGETWYIDEGNDYPRLGWEYENGRSGGSATE